MDIQFRHLNYRRTIYQNVPSRKDEIISFTREFDYIYLIGYHPIEIQGFSMLPKKTPIINLAGSIDDIYKMFNPTTRNEINRTYRDPDLRFTILDSNISEIYALHVGFEFAQNRTPLLKKELSHSKVFTAYYKNKLIALVSCFDCDQVLRVGQICSLRLDIAQDSLEYKLISYASRRLIYEVCKYGIANDFHFLDLGIVNLSDPTKMGVVKFKTSFTNEIKDTFIYRYETDAFSKLRSTLKARFNRYIH